MPVDVLDAAGIFTIGPIPDDDLTTGKIVLSTLSLGTFNELNTFVGLVACTLTICFCRSETATVFLAISPNNIPCDFKIAYLLIRAVRLHLVAEQGGTIVKLNV